MMPNDISSKSNQTFKDLKKSISSKEVVFIEGKKLVLEALTSNYKVEQIIASEFSSTKDLNLPKEVEILNLSNDLIADLYTTSNKPSKEDLICAIAKSNFSSLEKILSSNKNIVYLHEIQDPGNLGAIIRSSVAFDVGGIVLSENSINPFNTKVIRGSAGNIFKIPIAISNFKDLKSKSKENDYKLLATSSRGGELKEINKSILLFGNEGNGLPEEIINQADELITIKHSEKVESLNLAVSAGVLLYQSYKRT